jgi:hypothetical protein
MAATRLRKELRPCVTSEILFRASGSIRPARGSEFFALAPHAARFAPLASFLSETKRWIDFQGWRRGDITRAVKGFDGVLRTTSVSL